MGILLSHPEIRELTAETGPVLMVDRIELAPDGQSLQATKCLSVGEPYFQGHFPDSPVTPGVLQVAGLFQAIVVLLRHRGEIPEGQVPLIREVRKYKFRRPVIPGDVLHYEVQRDADDPLRFTCRATTDGDTASQGYMRIGFESRRHLLKPPESLECSLPPIQGLAALSEPVMNPQDVMAAIPHRFPFLLIDRVLLCDLETFRFVAVKNVTASDVSLANTPGILPEYLIAETAAQAGCGMALSVPENTGKLAYFMAIDRGEFFQRVTPGDRLFVDISVEMRGKFGRAESTLFAGARHVADMELKFALIDP